MPNIKDIFKSKHRRDSGGSAQTTPSPPANQPEFTFIRSDTHTQETIQPPTFPDDRVPGPSLPPSSPKSRPRSASGTSSRLRQHFHLGHRRTASSSSILPIDLPPASTSTDWEKRATLLVGASPVSPSSSISVNEDETIQSALHLYDTGDLTGATAIFSRLAQPPTSNPLAQVFYGLALRHGWGIPPAPEEAVKYLRLAAANSGAVESAALNSGLKDGGKAKGELALAIYELGNSYRQGWGVEKDLSAAREYYETAAMMGEVDAMNEAGWCWEEGVGGKKDRMKAARFYRMAERAGSKTLGNSWIYKDKYLVNGE